MRSDVAKKGVPAAPNRALFYALGYTKEELERPLIGVVCSYNEIVPGHMNLDKIAEAVKAGIEVCTLPGATAFVPALVSSGLPCDRFCFEGFLPQKKGRQSRLEALKDETRTIVFYESPHRLLKALVQMAECFGEDRQASVCREISKLHEESVRGTLKEVIAHFQEHDPKGEFVIVLAGCEPAVKSKKTQREREEE